MDFQKINELLSVGYNRFSYESTGRFPPYTLLYLLGIDIVFSTYAYEECLSGVMKCFEYRTYRVEDQADALKWYYAIYEELVENLSFAPCHLLLRRYLKNRTYRKSTGSFPYRQGLSQLYKICFERPKVDDKGKTWISIAIYERSNRDWSRQNLSRRYSYNLTNSHPGKDREEYYYKN